MLVAIYRLTLHPLAKYPGRFVCKISSWPFYFQCLEGDGHLIQAFEHEKYGPVVRIAPDTLCINTAGALQEIYSNRRANVRKSDWYKTVDAPSGSFSTHSELDHGAHAKRRRVLEHAFSENALKSASGFVIDNVTQFLEHIGKKAKESDEWSEPKLISDWTCFLYYDITGDLAFGESFHAMERGKCEAANDVINGAQFIYPVSLQSLGCMMMSIADSVPSTSIARLPTIHLAHPAIPTLSQIPGFTRRSRRPRRDQFLPIRGGSNPRPP